MNNFQIEILRSEKWWSKVFVGFVLLLFHSLYISLKTIFRHTLQFKPLVAVFQKLHFFAFQQPMREKSYNLPN